MSDDLTKRLAAIFEVEAALIASVPSLYEAIKRYEEEMWQWFRDVIEP
jgi:hypothetical protein